MSDLLEERWLPDWSARRVAPATQQTLYSILDWSYRLLPEKEKRAFRSVSVFFGQFDLDAAEAVIDKDIEAASILAELSGKSLLSLRQSRQGTRYRLIDTTKRYARDRLVEADEAREARHRHAMFFMQVLQNLKESDFGQSLPKILTTEIDDVLAAVIWGFTSEHDSMPCQRVLEEAKDFERSMAKVCAG